MVGYWMAAAEADNLCCPRVGRGVSAARCGIHP